MTPAEFIKALKKGGLVYLADGKVGQLVPYAAPAAAAVQVNDEDSIRLIPVVRLFLDGKKLREEPAGGRKPSDFFLEPPSPEDSQ